MRVISNCFSGRAQKVAAGMKNGALMYPAAYHLAFRNLGLSIGLHAAERIEAIYNEKPVVFIEQGQASPLRQILFHMPLYVLIESFRRQKEN